MGPREFDRLVEETYPSIMLRKCADRGRGHENRAPPAGRFVDFGFGAGLPARPSGYEPPAQRSGAERSEPTKPPICAAERSEPTKPTYGPLVGVMSRLRSGAERTNKTTYGPLVGVMSRLRSGANQKLNKARQELSFRGGMNRKTLGDNPRV